MLLKAKAMLVKMGKRDKKLLLLKKQKQQIMVIMYMEIRATTRKGKILLFYTLPFSPFHFCTLCSLNHFTIHQRMHL